MKSLSLFIISFILLEANNGFSQIVTFYGPGPLPPYLTSFNQGHSIARTPDRKYIIGGTTDYVFALWKTTISGTSGWQRNSGFGGMRGTVESIRDYGGGTFVATGYIDNQPNALFLKIDSLGNPLVIKGLRIHEDNYGHCLQVVRDAAGSPAGTVIVGEIAGSERAFIHLTDGNGEPVATRGFRDCWAKWVEQTSDGFLVLCNDLSMHRLFLFKFSSDLTPIWARVYEPSAPYIQVFGSAFKQAGNVLYVTGTASGLAFLMQLDLKGKFNWAKTYGDETHSTSTSLAIINAVGEKGGIFMTGNIAYQRALILKTDLAGNRGWSKTYSAEDSWELGREIITTADSLIVAGDSGDKLFLIRTDLRGNSGAPCEHSVVMPVEPFYFTSSRYEPVFLDIDYSELSNVPDSLYHFDMTRSFCTNYITVPPWAPVLQNDSLEMNVVIHPTLALNEVNIDLKVPSDEQGTVTLFDSGKAFWTQIIPPGASHVTIDVHNLAPGLYHLLISTNGKRSSFKFIKQ